MVDAAHYVARFREASSGLGRAGTADWPGGPYMSMADAAAVYADLMQGGTGRGVIADEAEQFATKREALEAVADAMLNGGDGAVGDFGWNITKLNRARPLIRAALSHGEAPNG